MHISHFELATDGHSVHPSQNVARCMTKLTFYGSTTSFDLRENSSLFVTCFMQRVCRFNAKYGTINCL